MSKKLVHYYHLFANGNWLDPWNEQITALINSGLYEELENVKVGIVGGASQRQAAKNIILLHDKIEVVNEIHGGFEQETLDVLYSDVMASDEEFYVLYGHTKGAAYHRPINAWWRRDMIKNTVGRWQESVKLLDDGYDATGIFWRTSPQLGKRSPVLHPHFSGNFWWAKASYLRSLGPVQRGTRYDAEAWIGYNPNIRQYDMYPGYPKVRDKTNRNPGIIDRTHVGGGDTVTVYVNSKVMGPTGKLHPGTTVKLTLTPYVQILLNSGAISMW